MTNTDIIDALAFYTGKFPRKAVTQAIAQRDSITPELLLILENAADNVSEIAADGDYMAHLYAMYLLAQFRESRALPHLVKFFSADIELLDGAVGDLTTDGLDRILASTCDGDTTLIKQIIEDDSVNEYVRGAALRALVILVKEGVKSRDEIMEYFKSLFRGKLERKLSDVWGSLVSKCCVLYPEEVMVDIKLAYLDKLIDPFYIDQNDVDHAMETSKEEALDKLQQDFNYRFIEDTIEEMEGWSCFNQTPKPSVKSAPLPSSIVESQRRIGRNDPCPCGSGKKYKRCCGV